MMARINIAPIPDPAQSTHRTWHVTLAAVLEVNSVEKSPRITYPLPMPMESWSEAPRASHTMTFQIFTHPKSKPNIIVVKLQGDKNLPTASPIITLTTISETTHFSPIGWLRLHQASATNTLTLPLMQPPTRPATPRGDTSFRTTPFMTAS